MSLEQKKIPLHLQAENFLRELIKKEEYQKGKFLPNEIELSQELQISRNTLRQAINKLVLEGLLIRKKGVGTKVSNKNILGNLNNWLSFSQEMKKLGIQIHNYEIHISIQKMAEEIKNFFNVSEDKQEKDRSLVLERVRGTKDFPFVYFISFFNPNIPISSDDDFTQPLYDLLEKRYNIIVKYNVEEISARLAGEEISQKLDIDAKDPIMVRKRYIYDINRVPVEYNIGYYRADSFTYTIRAER